MKLPDNENLTAVREKILPVLKKYRAVLAVLLAGVLLLSSGHSGNTEQVQTVSADTFRGAVVLCDGADDASVRLSVTQAVSTVCGIGADKVTVLKMQSDT